MNKPIFLTVVLAAALTSFAVHAADNPATERKPLSPMQRASLTVDMVHEATLKAQSSVGFPSKVNFSVEEPSTPRTQYGAAIARYAGEYGVPVSLAHAVIQVESNYRPNARGSAGEVGLMQIKPATARGMGYRGPAKGLYDPETNIRFGMKYLGMAHRLSGGVTCGTILRYNAGHAAKRMNPVSQAYCGKVKRLLES
jgi:soluble lytic murein transglycosylase-like protein